MFARISSVILVGFLLVGLGGVLEARAAGPITVTVELLATEAGLESPEDVVFDAEGRLYAGLADGRIVRFQPDVTEPEVFAQIEGIPGGMRFDADGNLVVCARDRLLSIDPSGSATILVSGEVDGVSLGFINSVGIAEDGTMYFSNSTAFPESTWVEILERPAPRGHLLSYDPQTRTARVFLDGLWFANGVAVSPDGSFVLVAECTGLRVTRYWLTGAKQGESDIFIDNLPGMPDNISFNGKDTFWVASPSHGLVVGLDLHGNLVHHLILLDRAAQPYLYVTGVVEHGEGLYLSNIRDSATFPGGLGIGRVSLDILTGAESQTWGQIKSLFR